MKTFLSLLVLLSSSVYLATSQQNLCGDSDIFANDPSSCSGYLYCERDASNAIAIVYQMVCDDLDFPNYFDGSCYSNLPAKQGIECFEGIGNDWADLTPQPNPDYVIALCPGADSLQDSFINYADPADEMCQQYFLCVGENTAGTPPTSVPDSPSQACTGSLVFDRNHGRCTLPELAPCGSINAPSKPDCSCGTADAPVEVCEVPTNVPFPKNCFKYATCLKGEMISQNECSNGLQFNPKTAQCDRAENITPKCEYARLTAETLAKIPRAQPKSRNVNPLVPQLRQLIMSGWRQ